MRSLENKVAIITGASSGIGYVTAKLFAEEGAKVVLGARRQAELDALCATIEAAGGDAVALAGDVKEESYARRLVELAVEHWQQGVRVNAILPGATDTAMFREHNGTAEAQEFIANLTAMRRIAQPEEIARAVLYLACAASFSTGTALLVDGGVSINRT